MREVKKIRTEEELSHVYSRRKSGTFNILYVSDWCANSKKILKKVEKWKEEEGNELLYVISSWDLPASYAIFMIMSAPSLVRIKKGKAAVDVEFPTLFRYFDVEEGG